MKVKTGTSAEKLEEVEEEEQTLTEASSQRGEGEDAGSKAPLNISDIADALGISKTTVSRALSGKGRVSEETRSKVKAFAKENNYVPNIMAKGLAQKKTYNIALVVPSYFDAFDLLFLRKSMGGVCEVASEFGYDVLLSINETGETQPLQRILDNGKADGVILSRTVSNDPLVTILKERGTPFVAMGRLEDESLMEVDNDQIGACHELTSMLLLKGYKNMALFGGMMSTIVNQSRLAGFTKACEEMGFALSASNTYLGLDSRYQTELAAESAIKKGITCFVCMDETICLEVLRKIKEFNLRIPEDVKVASFYDSQELAEYTPAISALQFDATELGRYACSQLLRYLAGQKIEKKVQLGYQLVLRESTK